MWIYDKLFNRKIEGKSSLDDLAENVVVNKETNTTEIGGNLYVDGVISSPQNKRIIDGSSLPLNGNYYTFDTANFNGITVITFQEAMPGKILSINTGSTFIIIDKYFEDNSLLDALSSVTTSNNNHADIILSTRIGNGYIIINLSSVVLIYVSHEF